MAQIKVITNNDNTDYIYLDIESNETIDDIKNKIIKKINLDKIRLYPIKNGKIFTSYSYEGIQGNNLFEEYQRNYDTFIVFPKLV